MTPRPARRAVSSAPLLATAAAGLIFLAACRSDSPAAGSAGAEGSSRADLGGIILDNIPEEHLTKPVAKVNGVTIYQATYDELLELLRQQIQAGEPDSVERYLGARTGALEKAIDEELLTQEAIRRGYDPGPEEVRSVYLSRAGKSGTEKKFLEDARDHGQSKSEVIYSIRRQLALDRYMKAEIEPKISLTDEEVRGFYDMRPDLFTPDPWVQVAHIFVVAPQGAPPDRKAAALAKITRSIEKLKGGRSFESVAREDSEDETAATGGLIGWFRPGNLPESVDHAAFSMKRGEVSGVLESETGYQIIKVLGRKGGEIQPFDKIKDVVRERLFRKKRGDLLTATIASLRAAATIERLQA